MAQRGKPIAARLRVADDDLALLQMALDGATQQEIADRFGLVRTTVASRLKRIERAYFQETSRSLQRLKGRQLARLEWIYTQAARAWASSKAPQLAVETTETSSGGGAKGTTTKKSTRTQAGDPRHLETAMKALGEVRRIMGLEHVVAPAPNNVQINVEFQNDFFRRHDARTLDASPDSPRLTETRSAVEATSAPPEPDSTQEGASHGG